MKTNAFGRLRRVCVLASLGVACLTQSLHAHADTMLLSSTTMVSGSESATYSFNAPGDGTVTAELTNLGWPDQLSALSFDATTATDSVSSWSVQGAAQTETFQVAPGDYFAHITAAASGPLDLGL